MDAYKTPASDLEEGQQRAIKPVKAIVYGLLISIVLTSIASMLEGIIFGIALGVNLQDEAQFTSVLANNLGFLLFDLIMTFALLYYAGTRARKYAPSKEVFYGVVLAVITFAIYLLIFVLSDSFSLYPLWYNLLSLIVVFTAILYGAKPKA